MDLEGLTEKQRVAWQELEEEQRAFVAEKEPIWRRAHEIAAENPGLDVGDIYHVLATWDESPSRRLERSLRRAQLFSRAR